ncbi:MAG: DUF4241 domain-containing protein, partial [Pseudomonadota bacterium]
FAYTLRNVEPLHQKVTPGRYPIEVVTVKNRIAAIRVRFDTDQDPVQWHPANTPSGNGVYGVDAGNLAIFDAAGLSGLTNLNKEHAFDTFVANNEPTVLTLTDDDDCVITSSGVGDGAYPAFWGFGENDTLVSLYLDFLLLVEQRDNNVLATI